MVARLAQRQGTLAVQDNTVVLKFGGGVHSRASEEDINPREAKAGQNFDLDLENFQLRPRAAFDLVTTAPNASQINGLVSLLTSTGTVKMAYQAGGDVYDWDGTTSTSIGTVSSDARIRGRQESNWPLSDKVIITDLALQDTVKEWDGTTFQATTFTDENDAGFGDFKAKYCLVSNERAIFANTIDPGATTPHLIVGSNRGDFTKISVSQRPASGVTLTDPWFLVAPDNKPINGIVDVFGVTAFSTDKGNLWKLTGANATDFAIDEFHPGSGVSGNESLRFVGNDAVYGRQGRIESLRATDTFGDVATDDLSVPISDLIKTFGSWTTAYNSRLQRVYFFPASQNEIWTLHKPLVGSEVSPWSKWVTQHASQMAPTAMMACLDPSDGLEYVFWGDSAGRLFKMEGVGTSGDGGSANIKTSFTSRLFSAPLDARVYNVEGWIKYRKNEAFTITLTFLFAGESVFDESISITVPAASGPVFGGDVYWGGDFWFGTPFGGRLTRQRYGLAGKSNEFQIKVEVDGTTSWEINEIGIRFEAAS